MMRKWGVAAVILGVLAAVVAGLYLWDRTGTGGLGSQLLRSGPHLDCPSTIEVGEADIGTSTTGRFVIRNTGSQPLEIKNVRTSCVCIGLQRSTANGLEKVTATSIVPGGSAEFILSFIVTGMPGQPLRVGIAFATNDPEYPEHHVVIHVSRVCGGLATYPAQLMVRDVLANEPITHRLELYDTESVGRKVRDVRVFGLGDAKCVFHASAQLPPEPRTLGRFLGYLDVTISPSGASAGHLRGRIEVTTDEPATQAFVIPVQGEILGLVRTTPSAVVLPVRRSGEWSYTTRCICRPSVGDRFELQLTEVPAELSANLIPPTDGGPFFLEVTVKPEFRSPAKTTDYTVKLSGWVGEKATTVELPVSVSRE